jgi:hypothetical protein
MRGRQTIHGCAAIGTLVTAALVITSSSAGTPARPATQTKRAAESKILQIAARSWNHHRIADLIDARTGLLRNNVRATCRARGRGDGGGRYHSFVCVLRPWPAKRKQALDVTYRALSHGRARVHWLRLQHAR